MEEWQIDFDFLRVRHFIKDSLNRNELPELKVILFLIGVQELGIIRSDFSKEEKQDLMHVAVSTLLESEGYFSFEGRDEDGWPHWKKLKALDVEGVDSQEVLLKKKVVNYFSDSIASYKMDVVEPIRGIQ